MINSITSIEVSEAFVVDHRKLLRSIRGLIDSDENAKSMFLESIYTSKQNKKLPSFIMSFEGFSLLTDTWRFSRGEWAHVKAKLVNEFGRECVVVSSVRTRAEDDFYHMLSGILWNKKIVRQYPYAGFRIDFCIPHCGLFIEFDEEQHFSKSHMDSDVDRWKKITEAYFDQYDESPPLIRVKKGDELRGIGKILGYLAAEGSPNASDICSLYEDAT